MKKTLAVIGIMIAVVVAGVYVWLRAGLPSYTRNITVEGLSAPVTIERNRFAVPAITAQSLPDLFFAWGYVNAQDRMFQMEFIRRVGQGRISEFAGEDSLTKDIFLRAVGFADHARKSADFLHPDVKALYQRYVDGVNHYLDEEGPNLYMRLLGMKKEKWEISDSVLIAMMLNWSLAYNMKHEILYHRMIGKIGLEKAMKLMNFMPPGTPTIVDDRVVSAFGDEKLAALVKDLDWLLGCRSASNGWAIGPGRTAHGGAILCSDMQVHQSKLPNDFYLIRVKAGDFDVTGAQVAGLPFIASGYNRHIAWGLTNQGADVVDLFRESIDWEKKTYRHKGEEYPLGVKKAVFNVKGKGPVEKTLFYCGRKPVLSEVFEGLGPDISLDWAGFDGTDIHGFFLLNRARNYDEYLESVRHIHMSPQNLVYADDRGNIAYTVIGSLPLREQGTGNIISDGSVVRENWKGNIPHDRYPLVKNPERGFIASANNKIADKYPFELNGTYAPGYRYENIAVMLRDKRDIDVEYCKKMQTDTRTVLAKKLQAFIEQHVKADEKNLTEKKAYDAVLAWDGDSRKDSAGASIYNTFYVRFAMQTLADELGADLAAEYVGERYISMETILDMAEKGSDFFDDVKTPEKESVADIAGRAFKESCEILEKATGKSDPSKWAWGGLHKIRFDHVLGKSALFRPLVNYGPLPMEGDGETNNRARFNEVLPPYVADLASAPRIIVRFDPEPKGYMMLITGESEHFMSRHNTDMVDAWMRHEYFAVDEEPVEYRMSMGPRAERSAK
jgi:penicillin G amidase